MRAIDLTASGQQWLTDKQLDEELLDDLFDQPARSLVEANEAVQKLLYRAQVDVHEVTGEQYPNVKLIDFDYPERNHFLAINQFRIDTPGSGKGFIIPDIVLFVNGLPLVVEGRQRGQVRFLLTAEAVRWPILLGRLFLARGSYQFVTGTTSGGR